MKKTLFALIAIILLQGCAGSKNTNTTANPEAPKESYMYNGKQVEKSLSTIGIPFEITMGDVERQINANIKDLIYEDNSMEDNNFDNFMCKVNKRDNITVTTKDEAFLFSVPLKVWVRAGYKVMGISIPPQELSFDFNLKFGTKFSISPNWTATVQSFPMGYEWIKKPTLRLGGYEIPVTGLVERALNSQQATLLKSVDDAVKKNVEIKKYVLQAWNTAMQPYLLSEKYRTWLKVTPVGLQMTPLTTVNNKVKATIGIQAYTETITGTKPTFQAVNTVPDLKLVNEIADDFKVGIIAEIPLREAAKLTADTLIGQNFSFKDGKYNVGVTEIDIYGDQDKMVIKAGLKGSINGSIYYKGVPAYDPTTKSVYLQNFDYDLKTKNLLVNTANWFFQGKFAKNMKDALTFKIGGQIDEMKKQMQANLTNNKVAKGITLNGSISELTPDKVYLTPNSIIAVINANGKLDIKVDGL
ncbi:hypothetical protein ABID42_002607 [Arcicella rosea]|uniref:DUF4403 family protein n=1 Tax=Arcicella rosea TaxID=502909 RepID=UPI00345DAB76